MDVELFHRKALISTKLYGAVRIACKWGDGWADKHLAAGTVGPEPSDALACDRLVAEAHDAAGPLAR